MRLSVSLVLVALLLAIVVQGHAGCDHDAELARVKALEQNQGFKFSRRIVDNGHAQLRREQQSASIRIGVNTDYILNDIEGRACYTLNALYNTTCSGSPCTATCTSNLLVNSSLIATTVNTLLPELQNILSQLLTVIKPVVKINFAAGARCNTGIGGVPIPPTIISSGQTDDLLLIFTARPSTNVGTIATASNCFLDTTTSRPTSAQINIDPDYFLRRQTYNDNKGTLLHEVTHALGFSSGLFGAFINPTTNQPLGSSNVVASAVSTYTDSTGTAFPQTINYLKTPKVLDAMRTYYGCSSLPTSSTPGASLEESGSSGTAGSHFDKRIMYGELMMGSTGSGFFGVGWAVSPFTLAVLEDSGWYKTNAAYAATISGSTPMRWGKNTGCQMPTQRCENWSNVGGNMNSSYFCTVNKYAADSSTQCTFNLRSKGLCNLSTYTSNLGYYEHIRTSPKVGGVDQLMDYCPFVYPFTNTDCQNSANSGKSYESFSASSSCWDANLSLNSETLKTTDSRCFQYVCSTNSTVLSVKIGSTLLACPADQSGVTITTGLPAGYKGYISCPTGGFDILCPAIGNATTTAAPATTTTAPSAPSTTTAAPGTVTTTTAAPSVVPTKFNSASFVASSMMLTALVIALLCL
jgi:leishmanolysin